MSQEQVKIDEDKRSWRIVSFPEHPRGYFMNVGERLLQYQDQPATYDDAKSRCESYNSTLVEFRNAREFNEVCDYSWYARRMSKTPIIFYPTDG